VGGAPLASGAVSSARAFDADLALDAPFPGRPSRLVAVETQHGWGAQRIAVGFAEPAASAADKARLAALLAPLDFVSREPPFQAYLAFAAGSRAVELRDASGAVLRKLGSFDDAQFGAELAEVLRLQLRSRLVLGLRTPGSAEPEPLVCVRTSETDANLCGLSAPPRGGDKPATRAVTYKVVVRNKSAEPRRLYVLAVSPDGLKVIAVLPPPGTDNAAVGPNEIVESEPFYFSRAGNWRFLAIASKGKVNTAALEQRGLTARDPAACTGDISRAMCAAGSGANDAGAAGPPNWSAGVSEIKVVDKK